MSLRRPVVAGNWKMYGSQAQAAVLAKALVEGLREKPQVEIVVFPPVVYASQTILALQGSVVAVGAQDLFFESEGAYTGAISGNMLSDIGCQYVLVGHSERRSLFQESDEWVARKFVAAQKAGLCPILCVGETLDERLLGQTESVVERQLTSVLEVAGVQAFHHALLAYEPVWAIGTGKTATPEEAQAVHALLRARVAKANQECALSLRILYGGSVKSDNAADLFMMPDIDGGLVGGASLKAQDFLAICRQATMKV